MMSSKEARNSSEAENLCVVCFKDVTIYSIGVCDHAVCFECSTRMRVLCRQNECPICRQDLPKVVFTYDIEPYNKLIMRASRLGWQDRKYGMYFCSPEIQEAYNKLLEFKCSVCEDSERNYFRTFQQLKDHMRRVHELFYCDICVENLRIFSFERRTYTRQELAHHRRKGDPDDTSHRGHPICEFCDQRFMDSDELFRHLRRNHLYCHFCDADGKHQYYSTMQDLVKHFQEEHYLCEEGDCRNMPLTSVFREAIDLKAHLAREHSKSLSKSANKQARTLELEFTLAPRPRQENMRSRRQGRDRNDEYHMYDMEPDEPGGGPGGGGEGRVFVNPLAPEEFPALGTSGGNTTVYSRPTTTVRFVNRRNPLSSEDFPSLGQTTARPSSAVTIATNSSSRHSRAPEVTVTKTKNSTLERSRENFPALGAPAAVPSTSGTSSVHVRLNSNNNPVSQPPKVSIQVSHKPSGTTTHVSNHQPPNQLQRSLEAFPALGKPKSAPQQPQWVHQKSKKQEPKTTKVAAAPQLPPSDLSQFPTLSKNTKNDRKKKTSSILMSLNSVDSSSYSSSNVPSNNNMNSSSNAPSTSNSNKDSSNASSSSKQKNKQAKSGEKPSSKSKETSPAIESDNMQEWKLSDNENKNKNKKKKSKNNNMSSVNNDANSNVSALQQSNDRLDNNFSVNGKNNNVEENKNGIVKKRSELQIGALSLTDPQRHETGDAKPPPGFTFKPPPGFDMSAQNFPSLGGTTTDMTFTNSSGQSYSIRPNSQYFPPANFTARNENLCQKFMCVLNNNEAIREFKKYSTLFREGSISADKYYEHCKFVLGSKFEEIFPELLVLLPEIEKQQELYKVHEGKSKESLVVCEYCYQVLFKKELREHHSHHTLDNHFPSLDKTSHASNAWKNN